MSRTCDFAANWARFDANRGPAWKAIPRTPERVLIEENRWNPLGLDLRPGWTFDRYRRAYLFNTGDSELGIVRSSDGFFRFWTTHVDFEGAITGHGNGPSEPGEWLDFLDGMLEGNRKMWRREVKKSNAQTCTGERK